MVQVKVPLKKRFRSLCWIFFAVMYPFTKLPHMLKKNFKSHVVSYR